jgi:hypothetical protein
MSDKRSGLFESQGKEMSSTMTTDGLKDEVTQTLNQCKIIMTEEAEKMRKKIDSEDAEKGKNSNFGDPSRGSTSRMGEVDQLKKCRMGNVNTLKKFEGHSKNISYVIAERQNFMAKKRFLDRGDEIVSTFEYFSNVVSQVSTYTLDNYWRFVMDRQKGDTSNFKDGSILSHILRMCNERIV